MDMVMPLLLDAGEPSEVRRFRIMAFTAIVWSLYRDKKINDQFSYNLCTTRN